MLKIGDRVVYRPSWGHDPPIIVTIVHMEITDGPREKSGVAADLVPWALVEENRVIFDLSNDKWTYSENINIEATKELSEHQRHMQEADK
tara:strand:- start:16479 stop:16748 length:270 start_codon:yes stop_codon:yes gene_type:complete